MQRDEELNGRISIFWKVYWGAYDIKLKTAYGQFDIPQAVL